MGNPFSVIIEGAKLDVCGKCSQLGEIYKEERRPPTALRGLKNRPALPRQKPSTASLPKEAVEYEVPENYDQLVRKGREKLGMSQTDLANQVKERLSIIRKVELGKMIPDFKLARSLEHVLKVKLLVPHSEPIEAKMTGTKASDLTLGDVVQFKRKNKVETP